MGKETLPQGEVDALVREFESKLARLRTIYEQYFMGIEKQPPKVLRKDVVRISRRLDNLYIRNTASKFKLRSLIQKFNTYKSYWNRVEKQMEDGTYVRDIQRARRNKLRREAQEQQLQNQAQDQSSGTTEGGSPYDDIVNELDLDLGESLSQLEKELSGYDPGAGTPSGFDAHNAPTKPAEPAINAKSSQLNQVQENLGIKQTATSREQKLAKLKTRLTKKVAKTDETLPVQGASMDQVQKLAAAKKKIQAQQAAQRRSNNEEQRAKAVYDKLVAAKRQCNEPTAGLTYEAVKSSLAKQTQHLKKTRGANDVNFQVVIKDGKAFLKPELK